MADKIKLVLAALLLAAGVAGYYYLGNSALIVRLAAIVATCSEVEGVVEVRRKGETAWEGASVGTTLREGDWVRTGASNAVYLYYGNAAAAGAGNAAATFDFYDDFNTVADSDVVALLEAGSSRT